MLKIYDGEALTSPSLYCLKYSNFKMLFSRISYGKPLEILRKMVIIRLLLRCVAQLGRALRSGRRGRRFESCRIDEKVPVTRYFFISNFMSHNSLTSQASPASPAKHHPDRTDGRWPPSPDGTVLLCQAVHIPSESM